MLLHAIALYVEADEGQISGSMLCECLKITPPTLRKYTEELEDRSFLRVRRSRISRRENDINRFEIDFNGPLGNEMPSLKMPKSKELGVGKKLTYPPEIAPAKELGVGKKFSSYMYIHSKNRLSKDNQRQPAQQFGTVAEALKQTTLRVTRKRSEKVVAARKSPTLMLAGVKATWAEVMLRHHPTVPPVGFSVKEFAILKARLSPLLATAPLDKVFEFFIENWSSMRNTKFKWLRAKGGDVAPAPSLPELMRYWKIFVQAYADSRMVEATGKARMSVSREDELEMALATAKAENAEATNTAARLRTKLAVAERIAYAPARTAPVKETRTLTERRKAVSEDYNSIDIPDWK